MDFLYPPLASAELIGQRIRAIRKELRMTQLEFGEMIGSDRSRLKNWELGTRRPDLDAAVRICEATGATLDYLFLGRAFTLPSDLRDRLREAYAEKNESAEAPLA